MRIAISGYGKMGRVIEKLASERGHVVSARIGSKNQEVWDSLSPENTDAVIEFSTPKTVVDNISRCLDRNLPVVVGTTGWGDHLEDIRSKVETGNKSLLHASNFSIGVNLFFRLNQLLAELMRDFGDYKPVIEETHHIHKLDSPSGTAISLARDIISRDGRFSGWILDRPDEDGSLCIKAHRIDEVPGTHLINYSSGIDSIEIRHTAKSREGFAAGALIAAEWLQGKKGVFTMADVLKLN